MLQSVVIHDEVEFTRHNSALSAICYNQDQDTFVSADESCLRLWHAQTGIQLRVVSLPAHTSHFMQAIVYIDTRQLFVASALDNTLRVYDVHLNELAALPTGCSTIFAMLFDRHHNRLLLGGVDGCGAWHIKPRPPGLPEGALNAHYELTSLPKFFHDTATTSYLSRNRAHARKRQLKSPVDATEHVDWVQHLQLGLCTSRLYAQTRHWIDLYNTSDGAHLERWHDLFPSEHGSLTAFVVQERTKTLVCGTSTGALLVLSYAPISIVHVFDDHTQLITSLTEHPASHLVISSSLDTSVRMFDLEARRQVHRHTTSHSVYTLQLLPSAQIPSTGAEGDRFYCQFRKDVKICSIHSILQEHHSCLVPVTILQRVLFPVQPPKRANFANQESECVPKQLVVLLSMDKTVRIFPGLFRNEAPQFTWTPDNHADDLVAFAINPVLQHLFLLLNSQKLLLLNASQSYCQTADDNDDEVDLKKDEDATLSRIERVIELNVPSDAREGGDSDVWTSEQSAVCLERDVNCTNSSTSTSTSLRCLCVCPFPPVLDAMPLIRRPRQRRQSIFGVNTAAKPLVTPLQSRHALHEWEWLALGSESGQLLFWHTGLSGGPTPALTLDAHDASIVHVSASFSSALLVSLDALGQVKVWSLQPKFVLRNVLNYGHSPSFFAFSPLSEIVLSGYEDGRVVLHSISNQGAAIEAFNGVEDEHDTTVCAGAFLDEKWLVVTTSVDAVVKIWDQERLLLRQVTLATAVLSLCFFNADGDLLAGVATGSVFISRRDVLPETLPKPKPLRGHVQDSMPRFHDTECNEDRESSAIATTTLDADHSMLQIRPSEEVEAVNAALSVRLQAADPETSAKQLFKHVIQRPIEAAMLQPPVLRGLGRNLVRRVGRVSSSSKAESQIDRDDTLEDWRDEILPLSPVQKFMRASKQVILIGRLRRQIPASPFKFETLLPNPRPSQGPRRLIHGSQGKEIRKTLPTLGLGVGSVDKPLFYCKHQAPVPPKKKTPRKLWNAVGGEDRRLIVLQRNCLPKT